MKKTTKPTKHPTLKLKKLEIKRLSEQQLKHIQGGGTLRPVGLK
jgi:bacteriocin-like protein